MVEPLVIHELGAVIPAYKCLTLGEQLALSEYLGDWQPGDNQLEAIANWGLLQRVVVTIFLVSRYDPDWDLDLTYWLPLSTVAAIFDFCQSERRRWDDTPPPPPSTPQQPINWDYIYWRLHQTFPGDRRFETWESLSCQPLTLIEAALQYCQRRELEQLEAIAIPIALHGTYSLQSQGAKKAKPEWFQPFTRALKPFRNESGCTKETARIFMGELRAERVPGWVLALVDMDEIKGIG